MNQLNNHTTDLDDLLDQSADLLNNVQIRRDARVAGVQEFIANSDRTIAELEVMRVEMERDLNAAERQFTQDLDKAVFDFVEATDKDEQEEVAEDTID